MHGKSYWSWLDTLITKFTDSVVMLYCTSSDGEHGIYWYNYMYTESVLNWLYLYITGGIMLP